MSTHDAHDIEELVADNRQLALRLARRYSRGGHADQDLNQVALVGLFLAANRYDPDTGPFRPFAMVTIIGELKKHLRSNGWMVKVPRRLQEASITVADAEARLEQQLQRGPTPQDIAEETGMSVEDVLLAAQARGARFAAGDVDSDLDGGTGFDARSDVVVDVNSAIDELSPESRELLAMRFDQELTQREIADRLDISQSQVHRRLGSVLDELRVVLAAYDGHGESP